MSASVQLETQILFEIAMSIGSSLDLKNMAKESLRTYLRKLNCPLGVIYRYQDKDCALEQVVGLPRTVVNHGLVGTALTALAGLSLPLTETISLSLESGELGYLMPLGDYGVLLLGRSDRPLDSSMLASLATVNRKLGDACRACESKAQLEQAKRAAEAADQSKTLFLANMSHEIRTPMNGVLGLSRLLLESSLGDRERSYAETIMSSAKALLAVIDDVLDIARLARGELLITPIATDLHAELKSVFSMLNPVAIERQLNLMLDIGEHLPRWVAVDASRLRQVLVNLISNALKFTPEGTVMLRADCLWRDGDQVSLVFAVSDTGIGMDADQVDSVFQPFHQIDNSYTREQSGTGLGLAITRQIVELMGGSIHVDTALGRGSTFTVNFTATISQPTSPAVVESIGDSAEAALSSLHVLIVDDDATNQLVLSETLKLLDVSFDTASDGQEAVDRVASNSYDLVLMDVQMPILDGLGATRAIRQLSDASAAAVPVIAMTAHAMAQHREQCLSAGMNGFATKPVNLDGLRELLMGYALGLAAGDHEDHTSNAAVSDPVSDESSPLDMAELSHNLGGDQQAVRQVVALCLQDLTAEMPILADAIDAGDLVEVRRIAHRIKGASANVRANRLRDAAGKLEDAVGGSGGRETVGRWRALHAEYETLADYVNRYLAGTV